MERLERSYEHAERLTRREAKNFFHTFRFLSRDARRAICAIYAYSRRLDDAVDAVEEAAVPPEQARRDVAYLRSFLDPDPPDDELVPALRHTLTSYQIPRRHLDELIAGMEQDLEVRRYATFQDLEAYCYRAASTVGLVSIEIFGHAARHPGAVPELREEVERPAVALGIAMQLTNILRDVAEDLGRDRIYLPLEDLARFGYSESDLKARLVNEPFRELMRFEVARARDWFARAEPLYPLVDAEARYCPVLLARLYSRYLDRIEAMDFDVLGARPRLSKRDKLGLVAATWIEARRSARARRASEKQRRRASTRKVDPDPRVEA